MATTPYTRYEEYLDAILNDDISGLPKPVTREEAYLYAIAKNSGGGGGGAEYAVKYIEQRLTEQQKAQARENIGAGTSDFSGDYGDLEHKPKLNGVPLDGDMTTSDLGLKVTSTYDNENIILNIN